ncbi:mandelate racemase [Bordetella sp. H567]|uniref:mandelate racemase/muconate lactonizing enzyme family protein n=1 Tax=Bordetella sp. H567 TaxID=1697043 RepID=UPI00081C58D0|nr:mandelate racemase/muconate lactonizing enzyme family protein [Bordetella sp. H567]AOB31447.1 mandelate racemase [Bordetella sp. H567]
MHPLPGSTPFQLAKIETLVFRAPIEQPVQTSFGIMLDRPAVLVRVEDTGGAHGWGEVWCNFPAVGAEHRARVLDSCAAPLLLGRAWDHPTQAFEELTRRLRVLAIQTGEPGTVAQAIAALDIALWDLAARRLKQPLWRLLGGGRQVGVYASGLNPTQPGELAAAKHAEGYRAFKLKVGFGAARDMANLAALRDQFGTDTPLMVDANQAWTPEEAADMSRRLADLNPLWLEEPIPADHDHGDWRRLAAASPIPLAGGENLRGHAAFDAAIAAGALAVIQPDLGKWGGFSGCVSVGRRAVQQGRIFCPHWLGGGIGQAASLQLKAAVGGPGYAEVDANPNPLRDLFAGDCLRPREGVVSLPEAPGLGVEPDIEAARGYLVSRLSQSAT